MKIYRTSQQQDTARAAMQAAEWLHAMRADPGVRECREFLDWIQASRLNLQEFLMIDTLDRALIQSEVMRDIDVDALIADVHAENNVVALHSPPAAATSARSASRRIRRPMVWARAAAVAGVLLLGSLLWLGPRMTGSSAMQYATAIGEQKTIKLDDGSTVLLYPRTRISVAFAPGVRNIILQSGEATFEVAHDRTRPFRVHAGDSMVQAVGTQFTVNRLPSGTFVSVSEGKVKVSAEPPSLMDQGVVQWMSAMIVRAPPSARRADAVIESLDKAVPLVAGETARIPVGARELQRAEIDRRAEVTMPGKGRRLVFHDDTLADIVDEFNRYNPRQIEVPDDAARMRRYSGVFDANDPDSFLQFLDCCSGMRVEQRGDRTVVAPTKLN